MLLGSAHFRKVLIVRFLGYLLIQVGFLALILTVEPVIAEEAKFRFNQVMGKHYVLPKIITSGNSQAAMPEVADKGRTGFGSLIGSGLEMIVPVSTDFGIVIEKIGANAKVIADVDPSSEAAYTQALAKGVAHAKGTVYPGQKGNMYLFSHSTDAPWNIVRYNAIFYLLRELEVGDRVIMFYQGRRYDYIVFDKTITKPDDTKYLTDSYNEPVLTLQTCDPPGTLLNRLIVRAKLVQS
ncbi:sortase [Candidatus Daviesbacteria bacterium]|nr:sortase [Candidatus Daviesbacteria bacterium]